MIDGLIIFMVAFGCLAGGFAIGVTWAGLGKVDIVEIERNVKKLMAWKEEIEGEL